MQCKRKKFLKKVFVFFDPINKNVTQLYKMYQQKYNQLTSGILVTLQVYRLLRQIL